MSQVNVSDMPNPYDNPIFIGGAEPRIITFNDILSDLQDQFIFKMLITSLMFLLVMLYLQYYCKNIERNKRWSKHVALCNVEPILGAGSITRRDYYLSLISDAFFIPALIFPLIFLGHYTGWFI